MKSTKPILVSEHIHFQIFQEEKEIRPGKFETHEYVRRKDGTRTIAIDSQGRILLTYEYRHELNDYDWRVPGGRLEYDDEPLTEAAQREFKQETGYVAKNWEFLWTTSLESTVRFRRHFYLATGLEYLGEDRDPGETIKVEWLSIRNANEMALTGQIKEEISALAIARLCFDISRGTRLLST